MPFDFRGGYGVPGQQVGYTSNRPDRSPPCWSDPKMYDNESRDCKNCNFSASCRAEIVKERSKQTLSTEEYFRKYATPTTPSFQPLRAPANPTFPVLQPQQQQPLPNYAAAFRQIVATQESQRQGYPPGYPPQVQYGEYGWMTDPLHVALASVPTPMRPQMPGESFIERAGKNAALAMAEALFMQGVLSIRQLVLAPKSYQPINSPMPMVQINPLPLPERK